MGQGYTRNDTPNNIANGNVIAASDLDGEFDAIVSAFVNTTGHTHDGTAAEGGAISALGPVQEYLGDGSAFYPKTTAVYTLGKASNVWSNLHLTTLTLGGTAVTSTAAELNYVDGVTSAIQTQLNGKQPLTTVLTNTTASFLVADETKLDAIEALADVTDTINVTSAGALMDSELTDLAAVKAINQSLITTASPTFTAITSTSDSTLNGLTVGRGAGNISTNTASGSQALNSNTTGTNNVASGFQALLNNTTGSNNVASGRNALSGNTTGSSNVASGSQALLSNTTGGNNVASGFQALRNNTTGSDNAASGYVALLNNTTGIRNTASGSQALFSNTIGTNNVASGYLALFSNTTGLRNTASGSQALYSNTTGSDNVASGYLALFSNTEGIRNTASGSQALYSNTTGLSNTASGYQTLYSNTTGSSNTASGFNALFSNTTGSGNTALNPLNSAGAYVPVFNPTTEDNRFCMGSTGVTNAYIQVAWTVVSDARDKTEIAPVPHGLDFVNALKPTSFRYKIDRDATEGHGQTRYGFLAQDILALEGDNPVIIDNEQPDKLRMTDQSLIAVMVNAIQEQQEIIENLETRLLALETK